MADVVLPGSVDELSAALRGSASAAAIVGVRGAGTKAGWGAPGRSPDVVVDTTGLAAVVEHAAGDLVVTVQAGAELADLQHRLAESGQWLALDPPEAGATVGGVLATAASGPRRLRYGTPRDLLIGITVVLVDGTVARSGGKVVKNVAGYDLGKLFTGSFGTLGVIVSATFRLHPLPGARRVVSVRTDDPAAVAQLLDACPAEPAAVEWDGADFYVLLETTAAAADVLAGDVARRLGTATIADTLPASFGDRPWQADEVGLKVTHRLGALGQVLSGLRQRLPGVRLTAHVGSGVAWAAVPEVSDLSAALLAELRADIASYDGAVVVVTAPPAVREHLDVWGPVSGLDVMWRIKERFDPDGRMNPGRFVGGI